MKKIILIIGFIIASCLFMVQAPQIAEAGHYNPELHAYFHDDDERIIKLNCLSGNHITTYVDLISSEVYGESGYLAYTATSSNGGPLHFAGFIYVLDTPTNYYYSCSKNPNHLGSLELLPENDWTVAVLMKAFAIIGPPPKKH
ncbi:hypothetical protein [Anaerovibrio lipolyticus]|uniref:hypothetical protein n=1 Tax=Anaerovibrio lipolyticus TaxID=82374 RepID=UPI00048275BD|nr:hypothetical protein [Anaerovibrio lipolyticus]